MIWKNKTPVPVITYNQLITLLIISATIYTNLLLLWKWHFRTSNVSNHPGELYRQTQIHNEIKTSQSLIDARYVHLHCNIPQVLGGSPPFCNNSPGWFETLLVLKCHFHNNSKLVYIVADIISNAINCCHRLPVEYYSVNVHI
jgi:hypothetical protein